MAGCDGSGRWSRRCGLTSVAVALPLTCLQDAKELLDKEKANLSEETIGKLVAAAAEALSIS